MAVAAPDPLVVPVQDVDERSPLLGNRDVETSSIVSKKEKITPLPKVQLAIICLIRVVEPICFQVIFPFINQMLLDVGAAKNEDEVGYAAGVVCLQIGQRGHRAEARSNQCSVSHSC